METVFQLAVDLQASTGRRVYVGEFGVLRWLDGRDQWLKDTLELWEQYGFDWTVHSIGGWNGWNHTFAPDAPENKAPWGGFIQASWQPILQAMQKNHADAANSLPTANDDLVSTSVDTQVTVNVLANDSDPDAGQNLAVLATSIPAYGSITVNADMSMTYLPDAGFSGTEVIFYDVVDNVGGLDVGRLTIQVNPQY